MKRALTALLVFSVCPSCLTGKLWERAGEVHDVVGRARVAAIEAVSEGEVRLAADLIDGESWIQRRLGGDRAQLRLRSHRALASQLRAYLDLARDDGEWKASAWSIDLALPVESNDRTFYGLLDVAGSVAAIPPERLPTGLLFRDVHSAPPEVHRIIAPLAAEKLALLRAAPTDHDGRAVPWNRVSALAENAQLGLVLAWPTDAGVAYLQLPASFVSLHPSPVIETRQQNGRFVWTWSVAAEVTMLDAPTSSSLPPLSAPLALVVSSREPHGALDVAWRAPATPVTAAIDIATLPVVIGLLLFDLHGDWRELPRFSTREERLLQFRHEWEQR